MTIWDNIYKKYQQDGEEYATLKKGLIPEFLEFIDNHNFKIKKALDLGCGNGKYLAYLKEKGFGVAGLDSSPTAVEMTKEILGGEAEIVCADMYNSSLPEGKYDLVISIAAAHHGLKEQVRHIIKEVYKSLALGGYLFITLPDNEGSSHWTSMAEHKEIEPGVRVPLNGPEAGLPHSSFTREEIRDMFSDFAAVDMQLLADRGRWIVSGIKLNRHRNIGEFPKEFADYALDFNWVTEKVWKLDVPVEDMAISELDWQFAVPFWKIPPRHYVLTPNEVMESPHQHQEEYDRIMKSDLNYPLDIIKNRNGQWEMLDGLHRLAKAKILGYKEVKVRKIPRSLIPEIQ